MWPESNAPLSAETSWSNWSLLVHVTVSPASTVRLGGTKNLPGMSTVRSIASALGAATARTTAAGSERAPHFFTR